MVLTTLNDSILIRFMFLATLNDSILLIRLMFLTTLNDSISLCQSLLFMLLVILELTVRGNKNLALDSKFTPLKMFYTKLETTSSKDVGGGERVRFQAKTHASRQISCFRPSNF